MKRTTGSGESGAPIFQGAMLALRKHAHASVNMAPVIASSLGMTMTRSRLHSVHSRFCSGVVRMSVLGCVALAACSCRSLPRSAPIPQPPSEATLVRRAAAEEVAHDAQRTPHIPAECIVADTVPVPMHCASPWAPPGIAGPWPHDEYLLDGGDRDIMVNVSPDKSIHGVEMEDTVAVYETIDGEVCIKPSNQVCLYAPRFAAVRQVTGVVQNEQMDQPIGVDRPDVPGFVSGRSTGHHGGAAGNARGTDRPQAADASSGWAKAPCRRPAANRSRRWQAASLHTKTST